MIKSRIASTRHCREDLIIRYSFPNNHLFIRIDRLMETSQRVLGFLKKYCERPLLDSPDVFAWSCCSTVEKATTISKLDPVIVNVITRAEVIIFALHDQIYQTLSPFRVIRDRERLVALISCPDPDPIPRERVGSGNETRVSYMR